MHYDVADDFVCLCIDGKHIAGGLASHVEKFFIRAEPDTLRFAADRDECDSFSIRGVKDGCGAHVLVSDVNARAVGIKHKIFRV